MPETSTESSFYPGLDTSHDLKQDQGPANVSDGNGPSQPKTNDMNAPGVGTITAHLGTDASR